jgi:hypothetical protein
MDEKPGSEAGAARQAVRAPQCNGAWRSSAHHYCANARAGRHSERLCTLTPTRPARSIAPNGRRGHDEPVSDVRQLCVTLTVIATASVLAWLGWGIFVCIAVMAVGVAVLFYMGFHRPNPEMVSDGSGDPVNVGSAPSVPFAEMVVSELHDEGIDAFYKVQGAGGSFAAASSGTTPWAPCDIYVPRRDAQSARELFPSAHANAARRHG